MYQTLFEALQPPVWAGPPPATESTAETIRLTAALILRALGLFSAPPAAWPHRWLTFPPNTARADPGGAWLEAIRAPLLEVAFSTRAEAKIVAGCFAPPEIPDPKKQRARA